MKYIFGVVIVCSLLGNVFFVGKEIQIQRGTARSKILEVQENAKIFPKDYIFGSDFALKDYSNTKFSLEAAGKALIANARLFHSSPAIITGDNYDKYLCAGFLYELSAKLWDASAPISIGMLDPKTKTAADAWELPYAYTYVGGKVLIDLSEKFSLEAKDFWEKISFQDIEVFFAKAFSEEALLGDIGFLYRDTNFSSELQKYGYVNSHIVKNLGMSDFYIQIESETQGKTSGEIFSEALKCQGDIFQKMQKLLAHYELKLNGEKIIYFQGDFYTFQSDGALDKKIIFKNLDHISMRDITMIHFFEGARVDSMFQLSCQGKFFPINIMQINPRLIEKI